MPVFWAVLAGPNFVKWVSAFGITALSAGSGLIAVLSGADLATVLVAIASMAGVIGSAIATAWAKRNEQAAERQQKSISRIDTENTLLNDRVTKLRSEIDRLEKIIDTYRLRDIDLQIWGKMLTGQVIELGGEPVEPLVELSA